MTTNGRAFVSPTSSPTISTPFNYTFRWFDEQGANSIADVNIRANDPTPSTKLMSLDEAAWWLGVASVEKYIIERCKIGLAAGYVYLVVDRSDLVYMRISG